MLRENADNPVNRKRDTAMQLVDFLWTLLVIFFMVIYFMILFQVIFDIFRSHDMGGVAKTLWILFIFIIPFLSLLIYLIVRGGGMAQRSQEQYAAMQKQQAEYIREVAKSSGSGDSATDQIAKAQSLLQSGAITQAEFDSIKAKALASS